MVWKSNRNPVFRSQFSETIFNQKYAHAGADTWDELAHTLVGSVCGARLNKEDRETLTRYIAEMKFIPGGRYLYYAGRPAKFYNNCFDGSTKVLTSNGWIRMKDANGKTLQVFSPITGTFLEAEMYSHGIQPVNKITFGPVRGRSNQTYTVRATRQHHWPLVGGGDTYDLREGDVVPSNSYGMPFNFLAYYHGLVFGDGNKNGQVRLCGGKVALLSNLTHPSLSVTYPPSADGDPVIYSPEDVEWKALPKGGDAVYIGNFIQGWIDADGPNGILSSVSRANIEWFREHAAYAGLTITGELRSQTRSSVYINGYAYSNHIIYLQNFQKGEDHSGFKVLSIEPDGEEEVYCPFEPLFNRIVIDHNIDTYQCYLLRAEEDTREDWADLSWKAESCLMTGGGIGVDYSRYRASGKPLARTGGTASGPLPKMEMLNEIGRRVMQGGSRRSAIYASLNWQHDDVRSFLTMKDWHSLSVGNTGYSVWDIKQQDFNYAAPMDMTNISVNYDTEWLEGYKRTGDYGEVFLKNVEQALRSAEPGFSFNFYEKENETLRNACTEVTSEDDSDVCNLGSINLGRIASLSEFADVIRLGTLFLMAGTFEATLPYAKVYKVREKNRRLGLGLMGMHEWLIQRGYSYEVTEELHEWLRMWKDVSDYTAFTTADHWGCSRPACVRAIAPTGTIGILAGTTTGVEPLFAVAYKRRYLKGTEWHYQYVVDGSARELIDRYGADPDKIESAIDLASDPEKRIRFQADVQDYVDQSISSTINLPAWGSDLNNEDTVKPFADTLARYAERLRGFTVYPDGARGGQPLTAVPYHEAMESVGKEYKEEYSDICVISGKGGSCGI